MFHMEVFITLSCCIHVLLSAGHYAHHHISCKALYCYGTARQPMLNYVVSYKLLYVLEENDDLISSQIVTKH